jgi:ABC-type molybdate transport system substrate-binding protein
MSMRHLPWIALGLSVAALGAVILFWVLVPKPDIPPPDPKPEEHPAVVIYTAAALRVPIEKAAAEFEKEYGIRIEPRYDRSETLLTTLDLSREGDLFLPADESYVKQAREKKLVEQDYALACMTAVAVVNKKYARPPKDITWEDFFGKKFRLIQPNPATAIGKLTQQGLTESGLWKRIEDAKPTSVGTVTEAANAVKLGSGDGAIIWDAVARQYPDLKIVPLPGLEKITANVTVAVCKDAKSRTEARWFAEYLEGAGQKFFKEAGYDPPPPAKKPLARGATPGEDAEITLFAGAMLRPAIEETIKEFEEKEHVRVSRVYNGCGILVAEMRGGKVPDLYLSCDPRFMGDVADLFLKPETVSNNQLVIAVAKGNPHSVRGLKDLGKEGLRVGVGHEEQCALGAITKETFLKSGVYARVRENIKVESPTGDLLVNQLLTGSLDAVVCYRSNVIPNEKTLDAIPVTGIPCAAPEQPVAIARDSENQELAARLIEYIRSAESRRRFEESGFGWGPRGPKR